MAGGQIRGGTSGSDGSYFVGSLSTCAYRARASAPGYITEYYDNATASGDADPVQVTQPDNTPGINFSLARESTGSTISGPFLDEAGQPIGDARVEVRSRSYAMQASGPSDPLTGAFRFTVPPGEYQLTAFKDNYAHSDWNGVFWYQVPAGEQVEGIELILPPAAYVRPRVFMADGTTPLPGIIMFAGTLAPNSYQVLTRASSNGVSDAEGRFSEDMVIPANWDVYIRSPLYFGDSPPYIMEYYAAAGSTPAITQADPLNLDPGETAEITFSIDPVPTAPVTPADGGQVRLEASVTTTVTIPSGAVTEEGELFLYPFFAHNAAPNGTLPNGFAASVVANAGGTIAEFLEPVTIEVAYSDPDVPWGVDETEMALYFYDTDPLVNRWVALPSTVDASANILTATTDHLSSFQVMGSREGIYLPVTLMPRPEQTIDLGDVIRTIDSPGQYTQGLAYDGTALWIISENRLYRVNAQSGAILTSFAGPAGDLQDLTWDGTALWVTSYQTGTLYRLSPSDGHVLHSIPSPSTKPVGLAWDGTSLWHTADNGRLYRLDPASGAILQDVANPLVNSTTMLAWDGSQLWLSAYSGSQLSRYRITDWQRTLSVPSRASGSKGIVWSEGNLWNAGFNDDTIYLIYVTAK